MKELPLLYKRKSDCCGCAACGAVCPGQAISMEEDEEGFSYPHINDALCIRCYKCLDICPMKI